MKHGWNRVLNLSLRAEAAALLMAFALPGNLAQAANNVDNHGGPTMQNQVKGFLIYWLPSGVVLDTSQSDGTGNFETLTQRFFNDISATSYLDITTQYPGQCGNNQCVIANGTGAVTLGGHWVDSQAYPNGKGTSTKALQDSDIRNEVERAINQNHWAIDGNSEFFVITGVFKSSSAGVVECNGGGCTLPSPTGFCAYHSNFGFSGKTVLYGYLSDASFNSGGCAESLFGSAPNGQLASDREVAMMSHEFFETITDQQGNAWWDSITGNEIGDNCNQIGANIKMNANSYWVQQQWSNASSSCVSAFGPSIQLSIGTGGDDLRGDSSAVAALNKPGGATFEDVTLKTQSESGWGNNTGHIVVDSFNQSSQTALGQVAITLTSHDSFLESPDNWNIQNLLATVFSPTGSILCRQSLSGDPLARLTQQAPTGTFPMTNCAPAPPPASITKAHITVSTGNDDARSDTELWATINGDPPFCLKPSNNADSDGVCNNGGSAHDQNGNQSWNNWTSSAQTFNLAVPEPLASISTLTIQLIEHNSGFESDDNWDIQGINVSLTDSTGNTKTVLNLSNPNNGNNCIARLKGSPNSTTVAFGLNGSNSHVYVGGKAGGQTTTCSNNGG
jgi:hypothetical protein